MTILVFFSFACLEHQQINAFYFILFFFFVKLISPNNQTIKVTKNRSTTIKPLSEYSEMDSCKAYTILFKTQTLLSYHYSLSSCINKRIHNDNRYHNSILICHSVSIVLHTLADTSGLYKTLHFYLMLIIILNRSYKFVWNTVKLMKINNLTQNSLIF